MAVVRYVAKRFLGYLVVLFIGLTITFFLPRLMPGSPIDNYIGQMQSRAGQNLAPEAIAELRRDLEQLYGLNGSLGEQYVNFLKRVLLHFDFGPSFTSYPEPVSRIILNALPWTLALLVTSTLIAWMIGNLVGVVAGYFNKRRFAAALEIMGIVLYPIPYYVMALTVVILLAYTLGAFPITSTFLPGPLTFQRVVWIVYNSTLPALTLVLAGFGWNILSMKALAVSTKEEGFVQFARLKGVPDWRRMNRYVFRNALLPQITALILSLGTIFNGALLTEMLFAYPGIGMLMRTAAGAGDYNLLYGTITTTIIAVSTAAFVLDLVYPLFDPRIRLKG